MRTPISTLAAAVLSWSVVGCGLGTGSTPDGMRFEVPEIGIVAAFPDGWDVTTISEEPDLGFIHVGLDRFEPGAEMRPILVAEQPKRRDQARSFGCSLAWYGPLSITADESLELLYGVPSDDASVVTLESLDGRISRASFEDPLAPGVHHEQYAVDAGDAIVVLWCGGPVPRRDEWYSIAESIEPIPAVN